MVEIKACSDNSTLDMFVHGHARRSEVCAAISALMETFCCFAREKGTCEAHSGCVEISIPASEASRAWYSFALSGLALIALSYPDEVTIK